jgi:hypothetical protein
MRNLLRSPRALVILATGVILATMAAHYATRQKVVLVTFDGPWAFAPDPHDAGSIFAFAPKTKTHRDLIMNSSEQKTTLAAGIYEMALPGARRGGASIDPNILQAKIDAQGVQHALNAQFERYAVRLPKPEAYVASSIGRLRAGASYPPGPSTENNYAMTVSLRYRVASLAGFALSGSRDGGESFRQGLPVKKPSLSFSIQPLSGEEIDECETHVREAFRDLAKLVNVTIYVDIVGAPDECHASDPQKPPD